MPNALLALAIAAAAPGPAPSPAPPPAAPPSIVPPAAAAPGAAQPAPASPGSIIETLSNDIVVQHDGSYTSTRTMTIKVVREDAIRGAAVISIPISRSLQRFELLEAWTETADHQRIAVTPDQVMTQAPPYSGEQATLSDIDLKLLNFPQVGVGARVHFAVRTTQVVPYFPNVFTFEAGHGPWAALLDGSIGIDAPADMPLRSDVAGMTAAKPITTGGRTRYAWRYASGRYRAPEPGELAAIDGPIHLIVSSLPGWAGLAQAYQSRATAREQPTAAIRALADQLTKGMTDDRSKVAALATWVQRKIRYINIVLGVGGFVPASADDVLRNRYGDCKGRATLLNAMLAAEGIDSSSVLINATPTYRAPTAAGQIFNHMINYVPSLDTFIDTTSPYTDFGDLPAADRDKFVVVTRTGETRRTPPNGPAPERYVSRHDLTINADGSIDGTSTITPGGGNIADVRSIAAGTPNRDPAELAGTMMRNNGSPGSGTVSFPDPLAPAAAIRITGRWHIDDAINADGPGAVRLPYAIALETIAGVASGAARLAPTVPAVCGAVSLVEYFTVRFPKELTIVALPKPARQDNPTISYASDWVRDGQTVSVTRSYASHYPGRTCSPETLIAAQQAKRVIAKDVAAQIVYTRQ